MSQVASQPIVSAVDRRNFAVSLRNQTLACRVRHEKFGVRRALSREQLRKAAEAFDADSKQMSASKKLIDTRDPAYKKVINVKTRVANYWKAMTTPYPDAGIRLIRRDQVEAFTAEMNKFEAELAEAAAGLQEKYTELRTRAQEKLGDLFNDADYPSRIDQEFGLSWDFPSIEPPAYLKNLHPELYEQECKKIEARFAEAVSLAEQAFVQQFNDLVSHLVDRLKGDDDGKPKIFRDSAVENLNAFFSQFKALDIGSSEQLQRLVDQAQNAIKGIKPDDLRSNADTRAAVTAALAEIGAQVDGMMINKPERAIRLEDDE